MVRLMSTDVKFVVAVWVTFTIVVPAPDIVALAVDELGIVTIPAGLDEYVRVYVSVLLVVKTSKLIVSFKTNFLTNILFEAVNEAVIWFDVIVTYPSAPAIL